MYCFVFLVLHSFPTWENYQLSGFGKGLGFCETSMRTDPEAQLLVEQNRGVGLGLPPAQRGPVLGSLVLAPLHINITRHIVPSAWRYSGQERCLEERPDWHTTLYSTSFRPLFLCSHSLQGCNTLGPQNRTRRVAVSVDKSCGRTGPIEPAPSTAPADIIATSDANFVASSAAFSLVCSRVTPDADFTSNVSWTSGLSEICPPR